MAVKLQREGLAADRTARQSSTPSHHRKVPPDASVAPERSMTSPCDAPFPPVTL